MKAAILPEYGAPGVLTWGKAPDVEPGPGQIRIRVKAAGVGPTDVHIRAGHLQGPFAITLPFILGFEAAGIVDAIGPNVHGVAIGDEVAVLLRNQGGYAEFAISDTWAVKPATVSWDAAAALPASAEAAVGALRQIRVRTGDHVAILGAGGSVGLIAAQVARLLGARPIAVGRRSDAELFARLGIPFVPDDVPLLEGIRATAPFVEAVLDAAGAGQLADAVTLTGDANRVVTLSDPTAANFGVRLSEPGPGRAPDALDVTMPLLADGTLTLKPRTTLPMESAAKAHAAMESPGRHQKIVLTLD